MEQQEVNEVWNYYLMLEEDLSNTSRYIEPKGQEKTYSFEFAKLLILSCTEVESMFKNICKTLNGITPGCMTKYKEIMLQHFPKIVESEVYIPRLEEYIYPFDGWGTKKLLWWEAYQKVKHSIGNFLDQATYTNACTALSALYVLILYMAKISGIRVESCQSTYILSQYSGGFLLLEANKELPDFEK